MSADSQKRVGGGGGTIIGAAGRPSIVPPQAVSDRSIIESVAGFINDVTLANNQQHDAKDHILWVKFESVADLSDPCSGEDWDLEGGVAPPLLLILGYANGIQVWAVPANGEAIEVMSWRHGNVKCLRILPTPFLTDCEQLASESIDQYAHKRPLIAICDSPTTHHGYHGGGNGGNGGGGGPQHCSMNFVSLKDGDQVKSIKFKTPIIDILANRSSIVVTFLEKIAVFDARTLEDRLTVTTCFASPGLNPNPVALGSRWMAYAEKKLLPSKRSSGGCDCGGVQSYTATVLNAAKSLGKGLRELGEHVAAGLTGHPNSSVPGTSPNSSSTGTAGLDTGIGGIITILDVKYPIRDISPTTGTPISTTGNEAIIAHFVAHTDPVVALSFDFSGMLLLTADKRGHNFHIFRIHPHPSGAALAAVHHLYVLHRGDTTAKVQDIAFSMDSRWVAVSTMRGTTHVFPVTSYGGPAGVRTHATPHVVNRLSRFHRSAGLSVESGRSSSPVSFSGGSDHYSSTSSIAQSSVAYTNPRQPPFPHPTVVLPLAQIRQPSSLGNTGAGSGGPNGGQASHKMNHTRQRQSSTSDDASANPLRVTACFAKDRSWLLDPPGLNRDTPAHRMQRRPVDSLFIMAGHGALIQYDLDPRHSSNIPKEKVCDDTPIELEVVAKAQWHLQRNDYQTNEIQPPLLSDNWLIKNRLMDSMAMESSGSSGGQYDSEKHHHSLDSTHHHERDDRWLAQVEIVTHAGPHRRLWMGPQFMFKTYNTPSGSPLTAIDIESVEIGSAIAGSRPARSNPMNMPGRSLVPVLIESGSCSSFEQSPRLMDTFRHEHVDSDFILGPGESQLREDLADAMRESGGTLVNVAATSNSDSRRSSISRNHNLNVGLMNISVTSISSDSSTKTTSSAGRSIAKVVNPLGTVTTVTNNPDDDLPEMQDFETTDRYLHENCDEALFRPVVTVMDVAVDDAQQKELNNAAQDIPKQASVATELIVPVIDETFIPKKAPAEVQRPEKIKGIDVKKAKSENSDTKEKVEIVRKTSKSNEKKNVEPESKKAGGKANKERSNPKKEKTPPPATLQQQPVIVSKESAPPATTPLPAKEEVEEKQFEKEKAAKIEPKIQKLANHEVEKEKASKPEPKSQKLAEKEVEEKPFEKEMSPPKALKIELKSQKSTEKENEEKLFETELAVEPKSQKVAEKEVVTTVSLKLPNNNKKFNKKKKDEKQTATPVIEQPVEKEAEVEKVEEPPAKIESVWNIVSPFTIATQISAAISEVDVPDNAWQQTSMPDSDDSLMPALEEFPSLQTLEILDNLSLDDQPKSSSDPVFEFSAPPTVVEEVQAPPTQFFIKLAKKSKKGKDFTSPDKDVKFTKNVKPEILDLPSTVDNYEEPELIQLPKSKPNTNKSSKKLEEEYTFFHSDELVSIQESLFKDNAISLKKSKQTKNKGKPLFSLPSPQSGKASDGPKSKYEFVETDPFPPLEPLSPFATMSFKDVIEDAISTADTLINLQTPEEEQRDNEPSAGGQQEEESGRKKTISSSSSIYEDPANLIIAMCSSLHGTIEDDDKESKTSSDNKGSSSGGSGGEALDSDYKSLELDIDEHFLDLESGAEGGGFLSSDDKDSSDEDLSCKSKKELKAITNSKATKCRRNTESSSDENVVVVATETTTGNSDEELEPLISNVTTPSSTASPNLSTKAIINTLPDALLTTSVTHTSLSPVTSSGSKQQTEDDSGVSAAQQPTPPQIQQKQPQPAVQTVTTGPININIKSSGMQIATAAAAITCLTDHEDLSSTSSFSSASRASLEQPSSSPTPSYSGENLLHFHGDSSGSL